jgi:hypothetical protein
MADSHYVLYRLGWHRNSPMVANDGWYRTPHQTRLKSFHNEDEALIERRKLEAKARKAVNPFLCGEGLPEVTHFGEPMFRDWLMDHEIMPPEGTTINDWRNWWTKHHKKWKAIQLAVIWEALNKLQFYSIQEQPVRPVVYALIELSWTYNDEWSVSYGDGTGIAAYRTRERAEQELNRLTEDMRGRDEISGGFQIDHIYEDDPFVTKSESYEDNEPKDASETPFYEIVEMELMEGQP